jgi:hypothetical protein
MQTLTTLSNAMKNLSTKQNKLRGLGVANARELDRLERDSRRRYIKAAYYMRNISTAIILTITLLLLFSRCEKISFEDSPCFDYLDRHYYGTMIPEYGDKFFYNYYKCN